MATKRKSITDASDVKKKITQPKQDLSTKTQDLKLSEQERQRAEFRWYENQKSLVKGFNGLNLNTLTLNNLHKCIDSILQSYGSVKNEKLVADDSIVKLVKGEESTDVKLGELVDFVKSKANNPDFATVGLGFDKMVVDDFRDNPFLHPLAKGLNITTMTDDWLTTHSFLTPEVYDFIEKGFLVEGDTGMWNTDLEKARKDLSKYKKVRKLVYRDGKSYITTVYESNFVPVKDEPEIRLDEHETVTMHGLDELKEGDHASFVDKDGETRVGKITKISHHPVTDKFGKADLILSDGTKTSKSLKLIRKDYTGAVDVKKETTKPAVEEFKGRPLKLSDLSGATSSLGGSSDVQLMTDKSGKKWAVKKARTKDGEIINGQLEQEMLVDNLYKAMGFEAPDSYLIKEGSTIYKIAPFIEYSVNLGTTTKFTKYDKIRDKVKEGFVMDALLGNWDVIGASKDNILVKSSESGDYVIRVDNGGALEYRAKGRKKGTDDFGPEVKELKTFLDTSLNPVTSSVYAGITDEEIKKQAKAIIDNQTKLINIAATFETLNPSHKGLTNKIGKRILWLENNIVNKAAPPVPESEKYDKTKYPSKATADYFATWEKFEMDGNTEIKEGIKKQILKIEEFNKHNYASNAKSHGITVDEYKIKLQAHVEKLMSESQYFRKTDIAILDKILHDEGRYMSQFEVGKSHGSYTPTGRAATEHVYFAFKNDIKHDKRPIYGYCSSNTNGVNNERGENPPPDKASSYGQVTVKIKKESALKKGTVTFDDSLGRSGSMAATPVAKPHFTSFDVGYSDPLNIKNTCERSDYTEVQYHGQLAFKDIESVHMSPNISDYSKASTFTDINKMIEIGRKTHVPIVIFDKK